MNNFQSQRTHIYRAGCKFSSFVHYKLVREKDFKFLVLSRNALLLIGSLLVLFKTDHNKLSSEIKYIYINIKIMDNKFYTEDYDKFFCQWTKNLKKKNLYHDESLISTLFHR
jgi:hypothetical protein